MKEPLKTSQAPLKIGLIWAQLFNVDMVKELEM